MEIHDKFMHRALQLAANGRLDTSPNPMVGAVIVNPDGMILGEGWHRRCGEGHAEVNAVAAVRDPLSMHDATMYVTLEPCSHFGKTPPCASLIIRCGIPRVVVGCLDPFEKVAGRGVAMLREAGVEVHVGCLEDECRALNRSFMTAHSQRRPFITLKWAQSADGYIDAHISTLFTLSAVHRLRALHDAILVGSGTWLADRPRLDTRLYTGRNPRKIVLDRRGRVESSVTNVEIINDSTDLSQMVGTLYSRGITSLLVEGGAEVLQSFIDCGLWDCIRIERTKAIANGHVQAPELPGGILPQSIETVDGNDIIYYTR